jgi:hypothetical protein
MQALRFLQKGNAQRKIEPMPPNAPDGSVLEDRRERSGDCAGIEFADRLNARTRTEFAVYTHRIGSPLSNCGRAQSDRSIAAIAALRAFRISLVLGQRHALDPTVLLQSPQR